jgi:hypothetical protein
MNAVPGMFSQFICRRKERRKGEERRKEGTYVR